MNNIHTVVRDLSQLTRQNVPTTLPVLDKLDLAYQYINATKWGILGMVDRTNQVVMEPRFHNVRNRKGRFARVVQRA